MSKGDRKTFNIQVIDGARNCSYSLFAASVDDFHEIFPLPGQDIEYVEDFFERTGDTKAQQILERIWCRPILKKDAMGIHGTLFYDSLFRKEFYKGNRECDIDPRFINAYQRDLFETCRAAETSDPGDTILC